MKRAHPDRQRPEERAAAERLARRLNEAYATLSNPIKRQAYDRTIRQQVIQDQIMRQYVGGFQTFDRAPGAARPPLRREPTPQERRERVQADRQASLTLLLVAVGLTAIILLALLFGSLAGSLFQAVR
jgi:curved DNA-binding protein CbpA